MNTDRGVSLTPLFALRSGARFEGGSRCVPAADRPWRDLLLGVFPNPPWGRNDNWQANDVAQAMGLLRKQLEASQILILRLACCESDDLENLYLWRTR